MPKAVNFKPSKIVADVRGTHGSGKSTIARTLLTMGDWVSIQGPGRASKDGPEKVRHLGWHNPAWDLALLSAYNPGTTSGGCDIIQDPVEVVRRVRLFTESYGITMLEGILVSHTYQRYADLAVSLRPAVDYRFYFLDTPLQVCLDRVQARNAASGKTNLRPFNTKNVIKDHHTIWDVVRLKCYENKMHTIELPYQTALQTLMQSLGLEEPNAEGGLWK